MSAWDRDPPRPWGFIDWLWIAVCVFMIGWFLFEVMRTVK